MNNFFNKNRIMCLIISLSLLISTFAINVFAKEKDFKEKPTEENIINLELVSQEKVGDETHYRLKFVSENEKTEENKDITINAQSIMYLDVSIYGSSGKVYGKVYRVGDNLPHNLEISLYNGTYSASNKIKSITTTNVGTWLFPTKISDTPTSTKFWDVTLSGTINGTSVYYSTYDFVFNKKAVEYPKYTDSLSGIVMTVPATNWTKVANPLPALTKPERDAYKLWYENTYNNGNTLDWSKVQVHHIKPRAYGGTHSYSNLIPLPTTYHTGTVSPWWLNY